MVKKIILLLIIIIAAVLRLYRLGDYPALNADEAAIGYNAYSLIQTGRDEHGNPWPVHFQSFNDYKPGLYFYLALPFVKYLGLNEWAVRLPGALLGISTVLVLYLLVNELLARRQEFSIFNSQFSIGEIAAFLLAISPWHIHFSRGAWEVNAATFFITGGVWLFLKAFRNPKVYVLSAFFFVLSLYTYHAARIITPLIVLGLMVSKRVKARLGYKWLISAGVIGALILIPLARDVAKGNVLSRAAGVGLFADPGPLNRVNEQRGEHQDFQSLSAKAPHNKPVNYGLAFFENWMEHFWGEFLFLSGDEIQRNKVPETSVMYTFDFLLLVVGFVAIIKKPNRWTPILLWILVAPVAAGLTFQSPHALRAQNMLIPLMIVSAYGLVTILRWLGGVNKLRYAGYVFVVFCIYWSFARYLHMYWVHMAKEYPFSSQYALKELVSYVEENEEKYESVMVTDRYDQPYILFLFYLNYPPEKFQGEPASPDASQGGHSLTPRDSFGFSTVREFDKYKFTSITNWDRTREDYRGAIIAGTDEEIPEGTNVVKKLYFPNGDIAFELVAN